MLWSLLRCIYVFGKVQCAEMCVTNHNLCIYTVLDTLSVSGHLLPW